MKIDDIRNKFSALIEDNPISVDFEYENILCNLLLVEKFYFELFSPPPTLICDKHVLMSS